ncbi:DTW domain-containing protein [Maribrevibacterium harenarium]|uniref:tRNA-uridine aminocarboxypropyltransferase n=1 Tax=Maribrevibacterium harenarium TaxID=2589817 RepID=A0A501WKD4_9GAMM|nr:tRNA-uridine aminocarboxypropyltransferase [Maribrevibacterium harenarium]TPE48905.1 DTW domain-containing protein [Maribrevibacterium harenarium]
MSRPRCSQCQYVHEQCVCDLRPSLVSDIHLVIVQDKREAHHAKNTVRLLSLAYSPVSIIQIAEPFVALDLPDDMSVENTLLLYPGEDAFPLVRENSEQFASTKYLLLLDATWRKAKKMMYSLDHLRCFPKVALTDLEESNYNIRKTSVSHGLSTLEASARALEVITETDMTPLVNFMIQSHKRQWRLHPNIVSV